MNDTVLIADHGPLRTITLNRPDKLNAFNEDMHMALQQALGDASGNADVRAVLLTGAGRGFCAGQDLAERDPKKGNVPDLGDTLNNFFNPNVKLIAEMQKPVIAAVNGIAAGGGANIALACDIVLAAKSAAFLQPFTRIGLVPDVGGSWTLTQLVGPARARGLAMLAEQLPAETAADWGLIWQAIDDDALMDEATAMATRLANGPTIALSLAKQALLAASSNSLDEQLALEAKLQSAAGATADYREGVTAFLEKRQAKLTGK